MINPVLGPELAEVGLSNGPLVMLLWSWAFVIRPHPSNSCVYRKTIEHIDRLLLAEEM